MSKCNTKCGIQLLCPKVGQFKGNLVSFQKETRLGSSVVTYPPYANRGVSGMLQLCYMDITRVLYVYYMDVKRVLQKFSMDVTEVLQGCNKGVTGMLQGWYMCVTRVLDMCCSYGRRCITFGHHFFTSLVDITFGHYFWTLLLDVIFGHHFWT